MTDSNDKGPLYFVFLNKNKELIHAGTTDDINDNDNDFNLNMVTPNEGDNQDHRIDDVVNKIMNKDTMKKYFSKNNSSSDESKDENKNDADDDGYNFIFNSENTLKLNDDEKIGEAIPNTLLPINGTGTTHTFVNVGGDGNCFFYALFYGILAICNNGKTASQLIQKMFDIHINVDDEHVVFAKDSNIHKDKDNEVRNEKYKNTELYFATRMRLFLGKSEDFKEKVRVVLQDLDSSFTKQKNKDDFIKEYYTKEYSDIYKSGIGNFEDNYKEYIKILTLPLTSPIQDETKDTKEEDILSNINNIINDDDISNSDKIGEIKIYVSPQPASDNEMKYPDASPEQVDFIKKYMNNKNLYIATYEEKNITSLNFNKYNNVIRLYNSGNHYQYIIPETPKSNNGGGKRKTQRKRPKSSHKNKSIKTK